MNECIKCGLPIKTAATTGRPSDYCSTSCRRAAEYEIGRINRRLADLENDLVSENRYKHEGVNFAGQRYPERLAALQDAITESEARLKRLLSAKGD